MLSRSPVMKLEGGRQVVLEDLAMPSRTRTRLFRSGQPAEQHEQDMDQVRLHVRSPPFTVRRADSARHRQ
jgi:hypothetical protein